MLALIGYFDGLRIAEKGSSLRLGHLLECDHASQLSGVTLLFVVPSLKEWEYLYLRMSVLHFGQSQHYQCCLPKLHFQVGVIFPSVNIVFFFFPTVSCYSSIFPPCKMTLSSPTMSSTTMQSSHPGFL